MTEKLAVGKQMGGFMQHRQRTRPLRVETLLAREDDRSPSNIFQPDKEYEKALAKDEGPEFIQDQVKESAAKPELKTELLPHQKRVVKRMREQPGLVVAHGLGSGKTLSSIGAIVDLSPTKARVVVPAALKENYQKEIKKHVKGDLPIEVESLQKVVREGKSPRGDLVVVDEAHRVRNPTTKGYKLLRDAPVKKRMLMTASPVYNSPADIAPLVNIAAGRRELPVGTDFSKEYVQEADKGFLALINPWAQKEPKLVKKEQLGKVLNRWVDYHGNKEDGFPSLTERRIDVPMNDEQAKLHAHAWGQLPWTTRRRIEQGLPPNKKDLPALNMFQSQVRQISSSQKKYTTEGAEATPKIQQAVDSLVTKSRKNRKHKAVVYANFLGTLDDYSGELKRKRVPYAEFRGDMPKDVRDQSVRDLNEGRVKALLVSGAGGEGLDLKGVRQVQVLEPHWNEEKLHQVIGRARRYGSHAHLPPKQRNVEVERYSSYPKTWYGGKGRGIEESLYEMSANKQKLNDQVLELIAKEGAARGEFAPGIPKKRVVKRIPGVAERGPNKEWTVSLSKHPAAVRGDHHDLRLIDPQGKAHSWAFNDMPEPGKGTYAAQMPTHSKKYALRKKPFTIPLGVYGGTRPGAKVEPKYVQPAEVISANNNRVHFLRHHGQETEEFVLKKISKPPKGSPLWALRNATKNRSTIEGHLLPSAKNRYKEVAPEQIDLSDDQQVMTPKLDGAHVLVQFPKKGRMMRVHSYRPTQRKSGLIEHTFKFPNFQNRKTPKALQGTIIRAELYGTDEKGKAVPATEVGGILNASVPNARRAQEENKVTLRLAGLDVVRHKGKDYQDKSFSDKLEVLRQVSRGTGGKIEQLPMASTPKEKKKLLADIKAGRYPRTREGVVLHELNKNAPPTKAKFKPDHDVYVRKVFTKKTSPKGQAGGFAYSFEPDGPIAGKVGTGFSRQMRKDMASTPEKFIGRVAKVRSSGRHQKRKDKTQGALVGAPAFKEWHIDKTPPELLKEAAAIGFPEEEHAQLRGRLGRGKPVYTTRISSEMGKYQEGQVLESPWGDRLRVTSVQRGKGVESHPFASEVSAAQRKQIGESPYDLVQLEKGAEKLTEWIPPINLPSQKDLKDFVKKERRVKAMMRLKSEVGKMRADWGGKDGSR